MHICIEYMVCFLLLAFPWLRHNNIVFLNPTVFDFSTMPIGCQIFKNRRNLEEIACCSFETFLVLLSSQLVASYLNHQQGGHFLTLLFEIFHLKI